MKPGVEILEDVPGIGPIVERKHGYDVRLRMWLRRGDPVRWTPTLGGITGARLEDDGATLFTTVRYHRVSIFPGLFYGLEGMRVGGVRRLKVAPHLAYGEAGIPDVIPPNAVITVEVQILSEEAPSRPA